MNPEMLRKLERIKYAYAIQTRLYRKDLKRLGICINCEKRRVRNGHSACPKCLARKRSLRKRVTQ